MLIPASHILLYDGVCRYCNALVQLGIRFDRRGALAYSPLQSEFAREALAPYGVDASDVDQIYLLADYGTSDQRLLAGAEASLCAMRAIGGLPRALAWMAGLLPGPLCKSAYGWIARRRYRLFGRYTECKLPSPAQQQRFILD